MAVRNAGPNTVPRIKTYSASGGYVYQYQFTGTRSEAATELFSFRTSQDRRTSFEVLVEVPASSLTEVEQRLGRALSSTERYAVAKMSLFAAFDEASSPEAIARPVLVSTSQVGEIVNTLDL